jgi:hypothetical protein
LSPLFQRRSERVAPFFSRGPTLGAELGPTLPPQRGFAASSTCARVNLPLPPRARAEVLIAVSPAAAGAVCAGPVDKPEAATWFVAQSPALSMFASASRLIRASAVILHAPLRVEFLARLPQRPAAAPRPFSAFAPPPLGPCAPSAPAPRCVNAVAGVPS